MPEPITPPGAAAIAPASPTPASTGVTPTPPASTSGSPAAPAVKPGQGAPAQMVPITALHEEREKRQQLQQEVETLKAKISTPVAPAAPVQPVADHVKELDKLWETDPRRAVQAEIYTAMSWRDSLDASVDNQVAALVTKYSDAANYNSEIRQYIRSLPLNQRGTPGIAEVAYYLVKGQKVDSLISTTRESMQAEILAKIQSGEIAAGGSVPGAGGGVPPTGTVQLTDDERKVCEVMGIPEAEYIKNKVVRK